MNNARRTPRASPPAAPRAPVAAPRVDVPEALAPQLATLVDAPPATGDWLYEAKFDGYRLLTRLDAGKVRLFTRGGHDWAARMPRLAKALSSLKVTPSWIDGEVVVIGAEGAPDFQALQNAFETGRDVDLQYFAFDLPYYAGRDLRRIPLVDRRELLGRVVERLGAPSVVLSENFGSDGRTLLQTACEIGLEGVIGKRCDSPYQSGRSSSWIKLKCARRQAFVIGGYTDPAGSRQGFGSLLLGVRDAAGRLSFAGNVGTGFDDELLVRLRARLDALHAPHSPFFDHRGDPAAHWVRPVLVADVSYAQWTREGRLRHAVFKGIREDKAASRVGRERPVPAAVPTRGRAAAGVPDISSPDRVIDVEGGFTKLDLVRHYDAVAGRMLPHLADRPVALLRAPQGIGAKVFFQKHPATLRIRGLVPLEVEHEGERERLITIPTADALQGASQMNTIEFHTWNAHAGAIESPDRMVFDLDPGEGVGWQAVQEAALMVREVLDALGLRSFVKTSGGHGLHVVVPCTTSHGWRVVKAFSREIVSHMARIVPQRFVARSGPRNRVGRIFIDYLRNGRGATTVAAFSARARPGMGVSIPISWEELPAVEAADQWTIGNALLRVASLREDPWQGYWTSRQQLARAMKRLAFRPDG